MYIKKTERTRECSSDSEHIYNQNPPFLPSLYISVLKAKHLFQGSRLYVFSSLFSCLVCPTTENLFLSPRISLLPLQTSGEDCVCECVWLYVFVCVCMWVCVANTLDIQVDKNATDYDIKNLKQNSFSIYTFDFN